MGLKFWLPTSLFKSKFIIKQIKKYGGVEIEPFVDALPMMHQALKKYIKENGHFVFVDVASADGDKVVIKV